MVVTLIMINKYYILVFFKSLTIKPNYYNLNLMVIFALLGHGKQIIGINQIKLQIGYYMLMNKITHFLT